MGIQRLKTELYSLFYLTNLEAVPKEQTDDFESWFRGCFFLLTKAGSSTFHPARPSFKAWQTNHLLPQEIGFAHILIQTSNEHADKP